MKQTFQLLNSLRKRVPVYISTLSNEIKRDGIVRAFSKCVSWAYERRRIFSIEKVTALQPIIPSESFEHGDRPRIAVQIHCFYPEVLPELIACVNRIPYRFDCYVSTDTEEKRKQIEETLLTQSRAVNCVVQCFPNRGRDAAPMLMQLPGEVLWKYAYLLHLHSKKSTHGDFGDGWMEHLLTNLLYSPGFIASVLSRMERENCGMIFPSTYYMVKPALGWHGNRDNCARYLESLGISAELPDSPVFPAGNMFWAKTDAVMPAFTHGFTAEDFPPELGQVEGTLAHCIERCWGIVVESRGYKCLRVKPASEKNGVK